MSRVAGRQLSVIALPSSGTTHVREHPPMSNDTHAAATMELGNDYPDIQAAIAGEGCSPTCVYKPFQSVSFIDHCNRRNGYIVYRAQDPSCADLYEFSNGLFPSVAAWEQATPCP